MVFYFGNQIGQASAKLLAYGILHMRGVGGQPGWFWLFALMGAFTVLGGIVYGLFLPDSFAKPHSVFLPKRQIFTEREIHILRTRVLIDDPMKGKKKKNIGKAGFKKAVSPLSNLMFSLLKKTVIIIVPVPELARMGSLLHQLVQQRASARLRYIRPYYCGQLRV